jgi:hypothetical protein
MGTPNEEEGQDFIVTFLYPVSVRVRADLGDGEMALSMAQEAYDEQGIRERIVTAIDETHFWYDYDKATPFSKVEPQDDF